MFSNEKNVKKKNRITENRGGGKWTENIKKQQCYKVTDTKKQKASTLSSFHKMFDYLFSVIKAS